jgi:LacI family transcriptional regulator
MQTNIASGDDKLRFSPTILTVQSQPHETFARRAPLYMRRTSLADVAKEAGVSAATVSRFMRGSVPVNMETRQRIQAAAERLEFDLVARKSSRIIAFLLSNRGVLNPFHSSVLVGAEAYCAENEYGLLFLPLQYSLSVPGERLALPPILLQRTVVAGAIIAGTNSVAMLDVLHEKEIPWVALGNNIVGDWPRERPRSVFFDETRGAFDLTRYLLSLGHRSIAFAANLSLPWYARRFHGYEQAMMEAGLSTISNEVGSLDSEEMGYLGARLLLERSPRPSAIFAGDDLAAAGVYKAARDHGLKIPEELTVVGFDDNPESAALLPSLTTVKVFTHELGRQAAELLLRYIARPEIAPPSVMLPTQLVRRESVAAPWQPAFENDSVTR